jgi:predicted nucleic acid-binding protein
MLIDSSVIVKFFSKEPGWEKLDTYIAENLTLGLALTELGSGLLKKVRKNELSQDTALILLKEYSEKAVILDEKKYLPLAFEYAMAYNIKIYDSLFIAAAFQGGHSLVSCDRRQCNVAESLGIEVIRCY